MTAVDIVKRSYEAFALAGAHRTFDQIIDTVPASGDTPRLAPKHDVSRAGLTGHPLRSLTTRKPQLGLPGQGGNMKKGVALLLTLTATAFVAASAQAGHKTAAAGISCKSTMKIAFVTPLTGGAGFLGQEQSSWAKYAVKTLAPKLGLKIQLVLGDTPVEQGAAIAQTLAQKFVADKQVVGILGPSTSGAVAASSKTYFQAGLAHISPSATRTSLTKGENREAPPAFFRVVPGDYIQGPSDARYMINSLHVKKVVILDFQEPYSLGLADAVEATLKAANVSTIRLSAPNTTTDYSAYVTKVPSDADIVFFPTQKPADAQTFAQQLLEQGKKAKVFGGDGSNDSTAFKVPGSYVSNFAPDITGIAADKALVAGWQKANPGKTVGSFGPPAYGAAQILMDAIHLACKADHGDIFMVGTFIGFGVLQLLGGAASPNVPVWALITIITLAAMGGCAILGVVIERFTYRPLRDAPRIAPLISALGVSFFLANSMQLLFGATPRNYNTFNLANGALYLKGVDIGNVRVPLLRIITIGSAFALMIVLWFLVNRTRTGKAMRATSFDREAAAMMGIDIDRVIVFTFVLGSALAGAAGVMFALRVPTQVSIGFIAGLKGFAAAVIGGIGSIPGAMAGGLLLGFAESYTQGYVSPKWSDLVVFSILIAV